MAETFSLWPLRYAPARWSSALQTRKGFVSPGRRPPASNLKRKYTTWSRTAGAFVHIHRAADIGPSEILASAGIPAIRHGGSVSADASNVAANTGVKALHPDADDFSVEAGYILDMMYIHAITSGKN